MRALVATAVALSSAGLVAHKAVADGPSSCGARGGERTLARTPELAVFRMRARGDRVAERTVVCVEADGRRQRLFGERHRMVRAAGGYLIYTRRDGDRTLLELLDVPTDERTALSFTRIARFADAVVDVRGRAAWTITTPAASGVRLGVREPYARPRIADRARSITGVRLRNGVLRWRTTRPKRLPLADATCAPRPGARVTMSTPEVVLTTRSTRVGGDPAFATTTTDVWACLPTDGRQRLVASTAVGFGFATTADQFRVAGTYVGRVVGGGDRTGDLGDAAVVTDVRTGATVGVLDAAGREAPQLDLLGLDATGRALAVSRVDGRERLRALGSDRREQLLDEGPMGSITEASLGAEGSASWRRDGQPRSVQVT